MNQTSPAGAGRSQSGAGGLETIRFPVAGMTCGSCAVRVTRALRQVDGVERVRVDLGAEVAIVGRRPDLATDADITSAIGAAGYTAALDQREPADPRDTAGLVGRLIWRHS